MRFITFKKIQVELDKIQTENNKNKIHIVESIVNLAAEERGDGEFSVSWSIS